MKLLIVDDLQQLRSLYKELFAEKYELFEAQNGLEAYNICLKEKPDLIICDFDMPNYNGEWLDRRLFEEGIKIPILLVTASNEGIFKNMLKRNTFKILYKPFSVDELMENVSQIVESKNG